MEASRRGTQAEGEAEHLIDQLQALHSADRAVLDLIALGRSAIPVLRRFLFRREPSGLYQPRVNAVFVLAALKAEAVLVDFLRHSPAVVIVDPVERTGEDAVINAAASALKHRRDDEAFAVLAELAERRCLAGVIAAFGEMRRIAAIPYLARGLSDDLTRPSSEAALRNLGVAARPALIKLALTSAPSGDFETTTGKRTRRSAVAVLCEIGVTRAEWSTLSPLMRATDERLAALTCGLALCSGQTPRVKHAAVRTLICLLRTSDWLLAMEIERRLAENYDIARRVAARMIDDPDATCSKVERERIRRSLSRVDARVMLANADRGSPGS